MTYSIKDIFTIFFKMGCVSFGGYMSLVSVVHKKFVDNDNAVPNQLLGDLISLAMLLPGPVAVNVVSTVGYYLRGVKGMVAAFFGIILPAFFLMTVLYYFYATFSDKKFIQGFFSGASFVIIAVIVSVGWNMLKKENVKKPLVFITPISFISLFFFHSIWHQFIMLIVAGALGWFLNNGIYTSNQSDRIKWSLVLLPLIIFILFFLLPNENIYLDLISTFATVSVTLFGGWYVMIPMLQDIVVFDKQWLTQSEFITAITLGQVTPGPILISAAFVGFKQVGFLGGVIATLAIFAPASILMVSVFQNLKTWLGNRHIRSIFDGLRMAVIGMIFYSGVVIFWGQPREWLAILTLISFVLLSFFKINPIQLVVGGGLIGIVFVYF